MPGCARADVARWLGVGCALWQALSHHPTSLSTPRVPPTPMVYRSKVFSSVPLTTPLRDLWQTVRRRCAQRLLLLGSWPRASTRPRAAAGPTASQRHLTSPPPPPSSPQQLVDKVPLFKAAEGERPLLLLPGRPPQALPPDQPLAATGAVREGQKQVRAPAGAGLVWAGLGASPCRAAPCTPKRWIPKRQFPKRRTRLTNGHRSRTTLPTNQPNTAPSPHFVASTNPPPQVKLAVAFQDVELLRSAAAEAVPEDDNPALLRCAGGAGRRRGRAAGLCGRASAGLRPRSLPGRLLAWQVPAASGAAGG